MRICLSHRLDLLSEKCLKIKSKVKLLYQNNKRMLIKMRNQEDPDHKLLKVTKVSSRFSKSHLRV